MASGAQRTIAPGHAIIDLNEFRLMAWVIATAQQPSSDTGPLSGCSYPLFKTDRQEKTKDQCCDGVVSFLVDIILSRRIDLFA